MTRRALTAAICLATALGFARAEGQRVAIGVDGLGLTYVEGSESARAVGAGGGALVEAGVGRFALDLRIFAASLDPDSVQRASYTIVQGDLRVRYAVSSVVALEVGGGRRNVSPAFAAQEIGVVRLGVFSENRLTRNASIWVRAAYLPVTAFTGGGSAPLSVELGLGVGVATSNGRFRAGAAYEFQRIDREVDGLDVPLQTSLARLGVAVRLF